MRLASLALLLALATLASATDRKVFFTVPNTGQAKCYGSSGEIAWPKKGQAYYGQDGQYWGRPMLFKDNGDGTITDRNTSLMWQRKIGGKMPWKDAGPGAKKLKLGGHDDWRLPTIKELYSLIDFRGRTGSMGRNMYAVPRDAVPYINTDVFEFAYGDTKNGERFIDAQYWSSTLYVSTTMGGNKTAFGVNFADGRIKGYPAESIRRGKGLKSAYVRYVRGNPKYGKNQFRDNKDGTITDYATGLTWMKADSRKGMDWKSALAYAENLKLAGHSDWRLPNAKELQGIVDYARSPDTTRSPAIDPIFETTAIKNEAGKKDYAHFWTSTTHLDGRRPGSMGVYIAFGRALGKMHGRIMDVHGAGAQRSDPKSGKGGQFHGPQGDARRVLNYVRCVRGGAMMIRKGPRRENKSEYPYKVKVKTWRGSTSTTSRREPARREDNGPPRANSTHAAGFIRHLDRNGDGKVSRSEFDGPKGAFSRHDTNNDGYISKSEAASVPPPGGKR
jgi:Protein of unknown function (DUF1566)/EF hand